MTNNPSDMAPEIPTSTDTEETRRFPAPDAPDVADDSPDTDIDDDDPDADLEDDGVTGPDGDA